MARLVVTEFMSLDGVMEAPGGEPTHPHAGWVGEYMGPDELQFKLDEALEAGSHLLGRVTYESFAGAWPKREGEFADKINAMPKYVVSSTLSEPFEWENSHLIPTPGHVERIRELKEGEDDPILVAGSAALVGSLIENELVDELRLMVFPVMIGGGLRPFPEAKQKHSFRLAATRAFDSGVAVQSYERG